MTRFWVGYTLLFFLELATVLSNEYFDYESDRQNTSAGPFTGGSRVLVEGILSFQAVRAGIFASLALAMISTGLLWTFPPAQSLCDTTTSRPAQNEMTYCILKASAMKVSLF